MDNALCFACTADRFLAAKIEQSGAPAKCSLCGHGNRNAFTVSQLAAELEPVMRQNFELAPVQIYEGYPEHGDDMRFVVEHVLKQDLDFIDEVMEEICSNEDSDPDEPFWSMDDGAYIQSRVHASLLHYSWGNALSDLKFGHRFFSHSTKTLFGDLFQGVSDLRDGELPVIRELPIETTIYRARIVRSEIHQQIADDPYLHVGPPPRCASRAGRMNADGVVVFYGALELETSAAELRPAIGDQIAVIAVRPTKGLKILDFGRLERARNTKSPSFFNPDHARIIWRHHLLRTLHALITMPVIPGNESDYLITQALTEYLDHVHDERFDGISFRSTQSQKGTNIVLFREPNTLKPRSDFSIEYVPDSLQYRSLTSVKYESEIMHHTVLKNGQLWFDDVQDEDD